MDELMGTVVWTADHWLGWWDQGQQGQASVKKWDLGLGLCSDKSKFMVFRNRQWVRVSEHYQVGIQQDQADGKTQNGEVS